MVDTTPQNQIPDDESARASDAATEAIPQSPAAQPAAATPVADQSAAPTAPIPPAPIPPAPVPPVAPAPVGAAPFLAAPRRRRGLIIAGGIVGAVIVLSGTFGAGVLVGTAVHRHHMSAAAYHHGDHDFGPRGEGAFRSGPRQFAPRNGLPGYGSQGGTQSPSAPGGTQSPSAPGGGTGSTNG